MARLVRPTYRPTLIPAGSDIAALVSAGGVGQVFLLGAGLFPYTTTIAPKNYQQIIGGTAGASILDGSVTLSSWTSSAGLWYASTTLNNFTDNQALCEDATNNPARRQEMLFVDGQKFTRVMSQGAVVTGTFWADYTNNRIYVFDDVHLSTVFMTKAQTALTSTAHNVLIDGLTVQYFASRAQNGALESAGSTWEIRNSIFQYNHAWGVGLRGGTGISGAYFHDNLVQYNGQLGVGCPGANQTTDFLVDHNIFTGNNTDFFYQNDWESGGFKASGGGGRFTRNTINAESGVGFWADSYCLGWVVGSLTDPSMANTFIDCPNGAVRGEISANIDVGYNNISCSTQAVGRIVTDSPTGWFGLQSIAQISFNSVLGGNIANNLINGSSVLNGIGTTVDNRVGDATGWSSGFTAIDEGNINVVNNDVLATYVASPGSSNFPVVAYGRQIRSGGDTSRLSTDNVVVNNNTYRVPSASDHRWAWATNAAYTTFAAYKTASGQDASSSIVIT